MSDRIDINDPVACRQAEARYRDQGLAIQAQARDSSAWYFRHAAWYRDRAEFLEAMEAAQKAKEAAE